MPTILLCTKPETFTDAQLKDLRDAAPAYDLQVTRKREEIEKLLPDVKIAAGGFPRELLTEAPALKWFQLWSAGADSLLEQPLPKDLIVTTASGVHGIPISEHILALLLAFARKLPQSVRAQEGKEWLKVGNDDVFELSGKTMLLLGVGSIGERTATVASALGMRVWGVRSDPSKGVEGVERMVGNEDLLETLPQADVVVSTVPLTEATRGMMGEREFRAMKRGGIFINIGRGKTVDEAALVRALQDGHLGGAGLDVFEEEPLPETSPLWELENAIITAHYSGLTPHYDERALGIFLENLRRYLAGEPLKNVVNRERGY